MRIPITDAFVAEFDHMPTQSTVELKGRQRNKDPSNPDYPTLRAARFELRHFAMRDIDALTSMAREHRIADTIIGSPHPYTAQFARMWIGSHDADWQAHRALHWAAFPHGDPHQLAGYAGLVNIDSARLQGELRFWVGRGVERRGDALEWSEAVIEFASRALHIRRIYALQMHRHKLAGHILERLGMRPIGTVRKRVFAEGLMEDVECWSLQCAERQSRGTELVAESPRING